MALAFRMLLLSAYESKETQMNEALSTKSSGTTQEQGERELKQPELLERADIRKRQVAIGVGNFMEWFDFAVYGYFAAIIGAQFFPSDNPATEMLSAFAVFAVGFVARPVGALILGPIGDRVGRKMVLVITVMGMGITTAAIGLVPSYAAIGITAPILIVILRCVQGMMVGGEWSSAATYLGESAPPKRRGLHASLVTSTAGGAFLVGTLTATLLNAVMTEEALNAWGWRIPFVASVVMAIIALYIRRNLDDTPVFKELQERRTNNTVVVASRSRKLKAFAISLAFSALFGVSLYYFVTYANNHLSGAVGMPRVDALWVCSIATAYYVIINPLIGRISDTTGRRPVILTGAAGITILGIPIFMLLNTGSFWPVLLGLMLLATFVACAGVMAVTLLVEVFPASSRSTGAALGHNIAYAILAGPGPLIAAALIQATGNLISPAYYLITVAGVAFLALFFALPETKDADIAEG